MVRPIRAHASDCLRGFERPDGRRLSIVRLSRHHPVVGQPLIHRAGTPTRPRIAIITVTPSTSSNLKPSGASNSEHASDSLRGCARPDGRCLSIVKLSRHHPVVGQPLIHRAGTLTQPRIAITVTPSTSSSRLVRPIPSTHRTVCAVLRGRMVGV